MTTTQDGITHRAGTGGGGQPEPTPCDGEALESARLHSLEPWA